MISRTDYKAGTFVVLNRQLGMRDISRFSCNGRHQD